MNKKDLEESIKNVEESITAATENRDKAQHHMEEGEIILQALQGKLDSFE